MEFYVKIFFSGQSLVIITQKTLYMYFILYWQISCFEIDLDTKFKEYSEVLILQLDFGFVLVLFACQPCHSYVENC